MSHFKYVGDPDRYYVDLGIVANPGDVREGPVPTDGRWVPNEVITRDKPADSPRTRRAPSPSDSQEK